MSVVEKSQELNYTVTTSAIVWVPISINQFAQDAKMYMECEVSRQAVSCPRDSIQQRRNQ